MNANALVYAYLLASALACAAALIDVAAANADEFEVAISRTWPWWAGFAVIMGLIACGALALTLHLGVLNLDPLMTAMVVGAGLPMVLRSKWFILKVGTEEFSIGFEVLYENLRSFVLKRVERVVFGYELDLHGKLVARLSLDQFAQAARTVLAASKFMTADTKAERGRWIEATLADAAPEEQKKHALAQFIVDQGSGEWALRAYHP